MLRCQSWMSTIVLLIAAAFHCLATVTSYADDSREAFLPLARVRVTVTADQLTRLSDITHRFAESRHFEIKAGDYSKAGRPVLNRIIEINKETFFKYGNFRNEGIVELVAYSHEAKEVWNPLWDELISAISAAFGDNVTRVEKR